MTTFQVVLAWVAPGAVLLGAYFGWRAVRVAAETKVSQMQADEWEGLARVRAEKIEGLEARIVDLEGKVAHMEGLLQAMQDLKSDEIANRVVARLVESRAL